MARLSNLEKAHAKINNEAVNHEGLLTRSIFMSIFNSTVKEFNLDELKISELKAMKYERQIDEGEPGNEEQHQDLTLEEVVAAQAEQIQNLTNALGKIATLTGYGNHLKEFHIDKWQPGKKDMGKNYT